MQVCTGLLPFGQDSQNVEVTRGFDPYAHPNLDDSLDPEFEDFILRCIEDNPSSRPEASYVLSTIESFLAS